MARYQVILAYDGTQYHGFQRQAKAHTVQGVIEATLRELGWSGRAILAAGRTDTGVHASGQVIAFDLDWKHSPDELGAALNAQLPDDVAARSVMQVEVDFHPRYDALARTYRYRIYCWENRDPLLDRYAWRVWPALDLDLLQQAASLLVGRQDFAAFGSPPRPSGSTQRTVFQAQWTRYDHELIFLITADAFLYRMVRRLVSFQVEIGQGRRELEALRQALELPPDSAVQGLAPAHGLTLLKVVYPSDEARILI
ncbi:MAG TPA: tRNA pseudouridine(38-40) synthase TruA [Anaerolineales bacterium]